MKIIINLKLKATNNTNIPSEPIEYLDWNNILKQNDIIKLTNGVTYLVPTYMTENINKDILIKCDGKCKIIFGKDYYNQWIETGEAQTIFNLGIWNNTIRIENVDLYTGKLINQVEPYYRTIFKNSPSPEQTGTIELINCNTNMEYGLLYSGSQNEYITCKAENINFEGVIFQELKAKNGGGLLSYQRNCNLKQIDPITYVQSNIKLINNNTFESSEPLVKIENKFIEWGNSCNIAYFGGKTFYLPKTNELGNIKTIRPIPTVGQIIQLECFEMLIDGIMTKFVRTKDYELQVGDIIKINGVDCLIKIKDRSATKFNHEIGYWIDFKLDTQNIPLGTLNVEIVKSTGLDLIGKQESGYLIFKYNKNFQTNLDIDHGIEYMLASNPFGVLSYNHKEITVDWENNIHDGYYRQSQSNVGFSNGYRVINCVGYNDEFNPPV